MENSLNIKTNPTYMKIDDETYELRFTSGMLSLAENVYFSEYRRRCDISEIIQDLIDNKEEAILTLAYAAFIAGGNIATHSDFCAMVEPDVIMDVITEPILLMFGDNKGSGRESATKHVFPWRKLYEAWVTVTGGTNPAHFWDSSPRELFAWMDALQAKQRAKDEADFDRLFNDGEVEEY